MGRTSGAGCNPFLQNGMVATGAPRATANTDLVMDRMVLKYR